MNEKIQAIALALGGFFVIIMMIFERTEFSWIGFIYVGLAMTLGFWKWIELDKQKVQN